MKVRVSGRVVYTISVDRVIDTDEESANLAEYESMFRGVTPTLPSQAITIAASRAAMTGIVGNLISELKGIDVDSCDSGWHDLDAWVVK